jgi:hypothetical protein
MKCIKYNSVVALALGVLLLKGFASSIEAPGHLILTHENPVPATQCAPLQSEDRNVSMTLRHLLS